MIWPASFELLRALMECWRFCKCVVSITPCCTLGWSERRIRIPSTRNEQTSYNYWHIVSPSVCSFLSFFFFLFFPFEGTDSCLYFPLILSASSLAYNSYPWKHASVALCQCYRRKWCTGLSCVLGTWTIECCYYHERLVFGAVSTIVGKFREQFWELIINNYWNNCFFKMGILFKWKSGYVYYFSNYYNSFPMKC